MSRVVSACAFALTFALTGVSTPALGQLSFTSKIFALPGMRCAFEGYVNSPGTYDRIDQSGRWFGAGTTPGTITAVCPIDPHPSLSNVNDIAWVDLYIEEPNVYRPARVTLCYREPGGIEVCGPEAQTAHTSGTQSVRAFGPASKFSRVAFAFLRVELPAAYPFGPSIIDSYVVWD